jgi:hypothetical protein
MDASGRPAREPLSPQLRHQLVSRHYLVGADEQRSEQDLDLPRADEKTVTRIDHPQRHLPGPEARSCPAPPPAASPES